MTDDIKKGIYYRDYLKKKSIQTGSIHYHRAYKKSSNKVNKIVDHTKVDFYLKTITNNRCNSKELWNNLVVVVMHLLLYY